MDKSPFKYCYIFYHNQYLLALVNHASYPYYMKLKIGKVVFHPNTNKPFLMYPHLFNLNVKKVVYASRPQHI